MSSYFDGYSYVPRVQYYRVSAEIHIIIDGKDPVIWDGWVFTVKSFSDLKNQVNCCKENIHSRFVAVIDLFVSGSRAINTNDDFLGAIMDNRLLHRSRDPSTFPVVSENTHFIIKFWGLTETPRTPTRISLVYESSNNNKKYFYKYAHHVAYNDNSISNKTTNKPN